MNDLTPSDDRPRQLTGPLDGRGRGNPLVSRGLKLIERLHGEIEFECTTFVVEDENKNDLTRPVQPKPGDIVTNSIGMKFAWIPPGTFLMGSSKAELDQFVKDGATSMMIESEMPQHRVNVSKGFYLGQHQVTRGEFRRFVEAQGYKTESERWNKASLINWRNPRFKQSDDHPVVYVSWNDAQTFCQWLSEKEGRPYRLPTEAEWEYACRAGTTTPFHFGATISTDQANYPDDRFGEGYTTTAPPSMRASTTRL